MLDAEETDKLVSDTELSANMEVDVNTEPTKDASKKTITKPGTGLTMKVNITIINTMSDNITNSVVQIVPIIE